MPRRAPPVTVMPNEAGHEGPIRPEKALLQRYYHGSTLLPMPRGAPALKLAISVDRDVHAKVVRAARAEHTSVSAWMTAAARRALLIREGLAGVAAWEAEHGALSEAELDQARRRVARSQGKRRRST